MGYYLSVKEFKLSDKQMYMIGLILLIVFTAINVGHTLIDGPKNNALSYYGYRRVVSTLQVIGLFIFVRYFSRYCENTSGSIKNKIYSFFKDTILSNAILSVSICSYGMYLTHYFWLYPLAYVSYNIFPIFTRNPIWIPAVLALITFMSWLTTWIFSKILLLKYFSGAH